MPDSSVSANLEASPQPPRTRTTKFWFLGAALVSLLVMLALGAAGDQWADSYPYRGQQYDYYSMLVHGFEHHQLAMELVRDPVTHAEPAFSLDTAYYHGRHYLYYGVTPAVILLLPYRLLTRQDLGINTAAAAFWLLGFGATLAWLRQFWRDQAKAFGGLELAIAAVLAAFLPATTYLLVRSMFYELPLMAGYAFTSAFFAALYEASQGRRVVPFLALASLCAGLAVGCHPNLIILLVPLAWCAWISPNRRRSLVAAFLPAAVIGAGLAWYNWARFGDITQIGFDYGQNSFFSRHVSVFTPAFIGTNLHWYFLTPPTFAPYFPLVFPGHNTFRPPGYEGAEEMIGTMPMTLLVIWVGLGLALSRHALRTRPASRFFLASLGLVSVTAVVFICSLQIRANRYMVDFATPVTWLVIVGGLTASRRIARVTLRRAWFAGFAVLSLGATVVNLGGSIQQFETYQNTHPNRAAALARSLSLPYRWFYYLGAQKPGLITLKFRLSRPDHPIQGPLYTTGTPGRSDSLYVASYPDGTIRLGVDHFLYGGPSSPAIPFDYTKEHTIEANLGSSYPPLNDPSMRRFPAKEAAMLKRFVFITLDGKVVLREFAPFFESAPWVHDVGDNTITFVGWNALSGTAEFTGMVHEQDAHLATEAGINEQGIFSCIGDFNTAPAQAGFPLFAVGDPGSGHLIFVQGVSQNMIRLGLDDWGHPSSITLPFPVADGMSRVVVVWGPQFVRDETAQRLLSAEESRLLSNRLLVLLEGRVVANFPVRIDSNERIDAPVLGKNPQGFSTAYAEFPSLRPFERTMNTEDIAELLAKIRSAMSQPERANRPATAALR